MIEMKQSSLLSALLFSTVTCSDQALKLVLKQSLRLTDNGNQTNTIKAMASFDLEI